MWLRAPIRSLHAPTTSERWLNDGVVALASAASARQMLPNHAGWGYDSGNFVEGLCSEHRRSPINTPIAKSMSRREKSKSGWTFLVVNR